MREVKIIVNGNSEIVSADDFFTFSVRYYNLSSTTDTIPERERVIVHWSTTGIWLIDDNELLIEEDGSWRDVSKELSFFLEWQNPDSTHSPISLRMLFYAIVDSLKHDYWKTPFGAYQEHSIRISEIAQHYSRKAIREEQKSIQKELDRVILKDLKNDLISQIKKKPTPNIHNDNSIKPTGNVTTSKKITPEMRETFAIFNNLRNPDGVPDPRQASIDRREKEEKATVAIDTSTSLGREQLANKKWAEMTKDEKAIITPMFEGMSEEDIQKYWDGTDKVQRESYIPACK